MVSRKRVPRITRHDSHFSIRIAQFLQDGRKHRRQHVRMSHKCNPDRPGDNADELCANRRQASCIARSARGASMPSAVWHEGSNNAPHIFGCVKTSAAAAYSQRSATEVLHARDRLTRAFVGCKRGGHRDFVQGCSSCGYECRV